MSTTSMTKLIPVTATFDGCFCSDKCDYLYPACILAGSDYEDVGCPHEDTPPISPEIRMRNSIRYSYIRTRWCCETFGMGEPMQEQPEAIDDYELETMDAKDAEALRRWTSE